MSFPPAGPTSGYTAPIHDYLFLLFEVFRPETRQNRKMIAADRAEMQLLLEGAAKFCRQRLAPLNQAGDRLGCRYDNGQVELPPDFAQAYADALNQGWSNLDVETEHGGRAMSRAVFLAYSEVANAANMAFATQQALTRGVYSVLLAGGSELQRATYLPMLGSGRWSGCMNLTEPHCGSDLSLIRTMARPGDDGEYRLHGQKIWITGGEQDLTENTVHLVLARLEGALEGVAGLSLFLVPKYVPDASGQRGERNVGVTCGGIEDKMGLHGSPTCVMNYDGARGWLVGTPASGLKLMFIMMNEARLGVALQGLAIGDAARQLVVQAQARSPFSPADAMVLQNLRRHEAVSYASRAFLVWLALQHDLMDCASSVDARRAASERIDLLTPVIKAYVTSQGFHCAADALGGLSVGAPEWRQASQFFRDGRVTMIYEGTNGVHAADFVHRRVLAKGGRALEALLADMDDWAQRASDDLVLKPFLEALDVSRDHLDSALSWRRQAASAPDDLALGAIDFLHIMALTMLTWFWARSAAVALEQCASGRLAHAELQERLALGRCFIARVLPEAQAHLRKLQVGADLLLPEDAF